MYNDETMSSSLAKLLNQFDYAIIDTCSMMEDSFPKMLDYLSNAKKSGYINEETRILVLKPCVNELTKHAKKKKEDKFEKRADKEARLTRMVASKRAIKILKHAKHSKILEILKTPKNSNFADNVIYTKVSSDRIRLRILVITQDKKLAWDLRQLNQLGSQKGKDVFVFKLLPDSSLVVNQGEKVIVQEHQLRNPFTEKPTKKLSKEEIALIVEEDKKLQALIPNGIIPFDKKVGPIKGQLARLNNLNFFQRRHLNLKYDFKKLKALLYDKPFNVSSVSSTPTNKPVKENVSTGFSKTENKAPASAPKENIKTSDKAKIPLANKPHSEGVTIEDAIRRCVSMNGSIIRDPSVPFVKGPHGDFDVTNNDIYDLVNAFIKRIKTEDKPSINKKDYVVTCSRIAQGKYYCWLQKEEKTAVAPSPKEDSKPVSKVEKKVVTVKKAKKEKVSDSDKPLPKEKKSTLKKPDSAKKPVSKKPSKETSAPKESKPKAKAKKAVTASDSSFLAEVIASDKRLKANLLNPNYAVEDKVKDLESQIKKLKKLTKQEMANLNYPLDVAQDILPTFKK